LDGNYLVGGGFDVFAATMVKSSFKQEHPMGMRVGALSWTMHKSMSFCLCGCLSLIEWSTSIIV
jgi:hypothetical protein